jgi:tetratricopeptide (TPR) repeat protein
MALGMAKPTRRPGQLINFFLPLPLIVLALFFSGCGERAPDFTPEELVEAEMQVREAFRLQDYEYGAELGQRWSRWAPDAVELKAWTVANLAKAGRDFPAEEMAGTLAAEHPDSPWSSFATAAAITWTQDEAHAKEAVEASEKALEGLPDLIEAVLLRGDALNQFRGADEAMAFAENLSREVKAHPEVRVTLASAMWPTSGGASDPIVDEMLAILDGVLQEDPDHLTANLEAAVILFVLRRDPERAFSHFERAAALTASPMVHSRFWSSVFRDAGLGEAEQYARVAADVRDVVENQGESPARWAALGRRLRQSGLPELAGEVEARVLEEHPRDPAVERVLANRFQELARELWAAETPAEERNAEVRARMEAMLREFIDRREHHDPGLRRHGGPWISGRRSSGTTRASWKPKLKGKRNPIPESRPKSPSFTRPSPPSFCRKERWTPRKRSSPGPGSWTQKTGTPTLPSPSPTSTRGGSWRPGPNRPRPRGTESAT